MSENILNNLEFLTIPAGTYSLGWHFSEQISAEILEQINTFQPLNEFLSQFSPQREIHSPAFTIAKTTIAVEALLGNVYELDHLTTLSEYCNALDAVLAPAGMRLPTEDELEVACGGALFSWGMEIPDGVPYSKKTTFTQHKVPNQYGLLLDNDPYGPEIVRQVLKLGDGGESIHGAYPWPIAWLSLASSWFLDDDGLQGCLPEFMECTSVRPILIAASHLRP
jgi:hypothetical protein